MLPHYDPSYNWKKATRIHTMLDVQEAMLEKFGNKRFTMPDREHHSTDDGIIASGVMNDTDTYQLHNEASARAIQKVKEKEMGKIRCDKLRGESVLNYGRMQPWDVIRGETMFFQTQTQMPHAPYGGAGGLTGGVVHTAVGQEILQKLIKQRYDDLTALQASSISTPPAQINSSVDRAGMDMQGITKDDAMLVDINVSMQLIADLLLGYSSGERQFKVRDDAKNAVRTIVKLLPQAIIEFDEPKDLDDLHKDFDQLLAYADDARNNLLFNRGDQDLVRADQIQLLSYIVQTTNFIIKTLKILEIAQKGIILQGQKPPTRVGREKPEVFVPWFDLSKEERTIIIRNLVKTLKYNKPYGKLRDVVSDVREAFMGDDELEMARYEGLRQIMAHIPEVYMDDVALGERAVMEQEARDLRPNELLPLGGFPQALPGLYVRGGPADAEALAMEEAQAEAGEVAERRLAPAGAIDENYIIGAPAEEEEGAPAVAEASARSYDIGMLERAIDEMDATRVPTIAMKSFDWFQNLARRLNEEDGANIKIDARTTPKSLRQKIQAHLRTRGQAVEGEGKPKRGKGKAKAKAKAPEKADSQRHMDLMKRLGMM